MDTTDTTEPTSSEAVERRSSTVLVVAAMASAAAGLVHAAAAGTHSGDSTVALLFALAAAAQLGWAGLALARPGRATAAIGAVLSLTFVGAWALSRTTGLPIVESLSAREPVGTQDTIAAVLGALALALSLWAWSGRGLPRLSPTSPAIAVAGVAALALAVPGIAAPHAHGPSHEHGHGHDSTVALAADSDGHAHDDDHGDDDHHGDDDDHGDDDHHGDGHDAELAAADGPIISIDDPRLSDEERAAAQDLIDRTAEAMQAFPDVESVEAAGYSSIGDGRTGFEHFINYGHVVSPETLDPNGIESIVAIVNEDGSRTIASAMYIMPPGTTMADVPEVAGEFSQWHDHQDLCWEGTQVTGRVDEEGNCARGAFRPTPPMLHVWVTEHECGPFAGIEGSHGQSCTHDH
jgi:hypothetical protein